MIRFMHGLRRRGFRVLGRSEDGAALPLVLVIFLVGFALVSSFLVAILSSAQVSQTTRSNIQAHAAAEAGIAAAQVKLPTLAADGVDICSSFPTAQLESTNEPRFSVTGSCDLTSTPATLTITSAGEAQNGDTATVEAVFAIDPPADGNDEVEQPVGSAGNAIVSVGGGDGGFANGPQLKLATIDGKPTRVVTREPTFTCNGLVIPGTVFAANDVFTTPCVVNGDLHIGGQLKTNNSDTNQITGNVYLAGSEKVSGNHPAVSHVLSGAMGDASAIGRNNVYANGNVKLHDGASTVYGDLNVAGTDRSYVNGTVKRNFMTNGTAEIPGTVEGNFTALGSGDSKITGTVKGNVHTSGALAVTGTVHGDIESRSTGVLRITGTVSGDIRTDGTVLLDHGSRVEGNIVALGAGENTFRTAPNGNVQVTGAMKVDGWGLTFRGYVQAGKTVAFNNTKVRGTRPGTDCHVTRGSGQGSPWSQNGASNGHTVCDESRFPVFPSIPTVNPVASVNPPEIEPWRDYEFAQSDWLGFASQIVTGSECNDWKRYPGDGWGSLSALDTNTVIDLRACGDLQYSAWSGENSRPKLGVDVALIVERANLNGMDWSAKSGTTPSLWVVNPGVQNQATAGCNRPAVNLENVHLDDSLRTMVYTPAGSRLSGSSFVGNVYSGSVCIGGTTSLWFSPMGLPSWGPIGDGGNSGDGGSNGNGDGGSESDNSESSVPQIIGGISAAPLSIRNIESESVA
ncbi:polymer-forming cytoskeletal protein [Leucobacter denitrificans]|uniref:Polymer-forming cytoskeletal protein n=1 Tax=Leucobacter denitrificans TaxID=683042 RepID=A0A7G9S7D3_9MICO|nr:polymer-forming cytoskeletal protein [Leucobacter denitrificans]QNN63758.1 polymer-forming cytoskeletal protein [Leucobacter denitrificans]